MSFSFAISLTLSQYAIASVFFICGFSSIFYFSLSEQELLSLSRLYLFTFVFISIIPENGLGHDILATCRVSAMFSSEFNTVQFQIIFNPF